MLAIFGARIGVDRVSLKEREVGAPMCYLGVNRSSVPGELCLVAAHNGDLRAARKCGLATAFVTRPTEHGPGQATDLKAEDPWDVVARDFQDLAEKLGC